MIFYFSGTGNSLYAAKAIGDHLDDRLVSIVRTIRAASAAGEEFYRFRVSEDERVGFVFPVHAWGPPLPVLQFIDKLILEGYDRNFTYSVITSGKNTGNTMEVAARHLRSRNFILDSGFHLVMPNNYMIAGDVYSKETEAAILRGAAESLPLICTYLRDRTVGVFRMEKGAMPWLLTGIINKAFHFDHDKAKAFRSTDACTSCGICERVCTSSNIKVDGRPVWGGNCSQCLACINYCPARAIEYGTSTVGKGRYTHPDFRTNTID
ncbi:MAG: EFR1 family ferrodoxin [Saccharofermentanales bacterium]